MVRGSLVVATKAVWQMVSVGRVPASCHAVPVHVDGKD